MLRSIGLFIALICGLAHSVEVKPTIRGSLTQSCIDNKNCTWTSDFGGCSNSFDGQMQVVGDYVTAQDLKIELAKCIGFKVRDDAVTGIQSGQVLFTTVDNLTITNTGWQPITLENGAQDSVVKNSSMTYFNMCEGSERASGGTDAGGTNQCGSGGWPGGLTLVRSNNARALFENNDIYLGYGEGIVIKQSGPAVVRGNRIGNTHSNNIYIDNSYSKYVVVESNITWGAPSDDTGGPDTNPSWFGSHVAVAIEDDARTNRDNFVIARNNLGVVGSEGIEVALETNSALVGDQFTAKYLGNTFVADTGRIMDNWDQALDADNYGEFSAISNILYTTSSSSADRCRPQATNDYNVWGKSTVADCGGSNDYDSGNATNPSLTETYANFQAMKWNNQPVVADFRLQAGSVVLGAGAPTLETDTCVPDTSMDDIVARMTYPFAPVLANWKKCLYYDFEGTARDAATPDPGALEYAP